MYIDLIRISLWAALIFSALEYLKDNSSFVSDPWFMPVIVAVLWTAYK
jgi:hypothetical protein